MPARYERSFRSEMWEHINRFYLMLKDSTLRSATNDASDFFDAIRAAGQQFMGITDATMTHGEAWHFCRLGRSLERADKTSRILDVKYFILLPSPEDVGTPYDDIQWSALLRSASALEMYRQRFGLITPAHVVEFLVLDREFPRAVSVLPDECQSVVAHDLGLRIGKLWEHPRTATRSTAIRNGIRQAKIDH